MFNVIAWMASVIEIIEVVMQLGEEALGAKVVHLKVLLTCRQQFVEETIRASAAEVGSHVGT
jgi:hypothetical protein